MVDGALPCVGDCQDQGGGALPTPLTILGGQPLPLPSPQLRPCMSGSIGGLNKRNWDCLAFWAKWLLTAESNDTYIHP